MLGNSPEAWVWDIPSLALYHNGENMGIYPGPSGLEMPHKFRMIIDREQRQLAFNIGLGNNVVFKGKSRHARTHTRTHTHPPNISALTFWDLL